VGAVSEVRWFDAVKLRATVAPALLDMVGRGRPAPWLADLMADRIDRMKLWEARNPRYRGDDSDVLAAIRDGLGLTLLGRCELVRHDLGVRDTPAALRQAVPAGTGSCRSTSCPQRDRCPLHLTGQEHVGAEPFMGLLRDVVEETCFAGPVTFLGQDGTWFHFVTWYALELVLDFFEEDEVAERYAADPTLMQLLRLSRRGAAIGWEDGGSHQGLLGWLDPAETANLLDGLEPYDFRRPARGTLDDEYLTGLREMIGLIVDTGTAAVANGMGIGLRRR
jgi:hypothetical protein